MKENFNFHVNEGVDTLSLWIYAKCGLKRNFEHPNYCHVQVTAKSRQLCIEHQEKECGTKMGGGYDVSP